MPTRRIDDANHPSPCMCREHDPPSMMVYQPGTYEHTCPSCGHVTTFVVNGVWMTAPSSSYTINRREELWTSNNRTGDMQCRC